MKKFLYLVTFMIALSTKIFICCPQGFSSQDRRPFFEQYEIEDKSTEKIEKEEQ